MDLSPTCEQGFLLFGHDLHGAAHIAALHAFYGHDLWPAVGSQQVDLGVSVAEHVDMGRRMVIDEDDEAQAMRAVDSDHQAI